MHTPIKSTKDLQSTIEVLLNDNLSHEQIVSYINSIHRYFESLTSISGFDHKLEHLAAVPLYKGKALGLNHAAQCLLDYNRTIKFLKATVQTIRKKQAEFPNQIIKVFYAGCGPYAPFLSLIAPLFKSNKLQFSLLEVNNHSMESAKKLIAELGFSEFIENYYVDDATTFQVPKVDSYHILFSETLDALLYRESYVPILSNLLPQFSKEIDVLPKNVILKATLLVQASKLTPEKDKGIGEVLNVRKVIKEKELSNTHSPIFKEHIVSLKEVKLENYQTLLLDTVVNIDDTYVLERNESSLTLPHEVRLGSNYKEQRIVFSYQLEPEIGLRYKFI